MRRRVGRQACRCTKSKCLCTGSELSNQASPDLERLAEERSFEESLLSFFLGGAWRASNGKRVIDNQTIKYAHIPRLKPGRPAALLRNPITPITLFQRLLPPQPSQSGPTHPSIHVASYLSLHADYLPNMYALEYRKPESKERKKRRSNSANQPTRRSPGQPSPTQP